MSSGLEAHLSFPRADTQHTAKDALPRILCFMKTKLSKQAVYRGNKLFCFAAINLNTQQNGYSQYLPTLVDATLSPKHNTVIFDLASDPSVNGTEAMLFYTRLRYSLIKQALGQILEFLK